MRGMPREQAGAREELDGPAVLEARGGLRIPIGIEEMRGASV